MFDFFGLIGVSGIILIIIGIVIKSKRRDIRDLLYVFGGLCLLTYSIYIGDVIFIILQSVFTLVAGYDFFKFKK